MYSRGPRSFRLLRNDEIDAQTQQDLILLSRLTDTAKVNISLHNALSRHLPPVNMAQILQNKSHATRSSHADTISNLTVFDISSMENQDVREIHQTTDKNVPSSSQSEDVQSVRPEYYRDHCYGQRNHNHRPANAQTVTDYREHCFGTSSPFSLNNVFGHGQTPSIDLQADVKPGSHVI